MKISYSTVKKKKKEINFKKSILKFIGWPKRPCKLQNSLAIASFAASKSASTVNVAFGTSPWFEMFDISFITND